MSHEIVDLYFFHDSYLSGSLINRLRYFRILFPEQICITIIEKTVVENPVIYSFKRLGKGQMDMLSNHMIARVGTKIFL